MAAEMAIRELVSEEELRGVWKKAVRVPEDLVLHNLIPNFLDNKFPHTSIRFFAHPRHEPLYYFCIEINPHAFCIVHVTTPEEHDELVLEEGVALFLEAVRDLVYHCGMVTTTDDIIARAFVKLYKKVYPHFEQTLHAPSYFFYTSEEQMERLKQMHIQAPRGFVITDTDVEADIDIVDKTWHYSASLESTKERLSRMPSVIIRTDSGRPVSWELSSNFGELCHLFTVEEFRGRGLGIVTELALAQKFARNGEHAFKFVVHDNTHVAEGTLRSPHWSVWKRGECLGVHVFCGFNRKGFPVFNH